MAKKKFNIQKNSDDTITVCVGRAIETINTFGRDKTEIFDAVRYALISKDVYLSEEKMAEIFWSL